MKNVLVLGAGTAGTVVANRLGARLPPSWQVTVVDPAERHLYQAGLVFLPFDERSPRPNLRPRSATLRPPVRWVKASVESVDPDRRRVALRGGERLAYDLLVIASGAGIHPEETPGLEELRERRSIHDFYTLDGALALRRALAEFQGGRLVVNVVEMPIKCPIAPLELLFLADAFFTRRGLRDQVELILATPLDGAFTRPLAARVLGSLLEAKGIRVEAEFSAAAVDTGARRLRSWDEREIDYDLLVSVPTHMGADFVRSSGLGDELGFVPTEPDTLLARGHEDIFVLGDATNLPTSKAGSVAHFQSHVVVDNVLRAIAGRSPVPGYDGHANCFIESGWGKAVLIDFNYDTEPLPGHWPLPAVGPLSLLAESRVNHWGKVGFRWLYWHALLPGRPLPIPTRMSMVGKRVPPALEVSGS